MDRRVWTRAGIFGFLAILSISPALSTPAVASNPANSNKPYSLVICAPGQTCTASVPPVVAPAAGSSNSQPATMTVTFTNKNKPGSGIQLGSDNLNVPSTPTGFSVISTSLPACSTPLDQQGQPCAYLLSGGTTVGFRNLNLPATTPATSMTITMSVVTPPPSATDCTTASPCQWTDAAKQSNDFSGVGNNLTADATSAYGTITAASASCPKKQGCSTTLANGGSASSAPGSIGVKVDTSSGKTAVTQIESIDFGASLDPSKCSNVSSPHLAYENLSNGADNGSDRSQTITIDTTDFSGYVSQACLETTKQFTALVIAPDGTRSLAPASSTTLPDGSPGFQGLLPDCGTQPLQPLQVDCNKNPGVLQRQTTFGPDGVTPLTHTLVAAIPPGFDLRISN